MGISLKPKKSIWDEIGGGIANAAKTVGNAANLGLANLTHNTQAANNARGALVRSTPQPLLSQAPNFGIQPNRQVISPTMHIATTPKIGAFSNPASIYQHAPMSIVASGSPKTPVSPQTTSNPHASIIHDLTHNTVTNLAGGLAKATAQPFVSLAKTDIINPTKQIAAQLSGNHQAAQNAQLQTNRDLGLGDKGTNFKGGLEHFAGNTAQVALTGLAPGISKGIEAPIASRLAASGASKIGTQFIAKTAAAAPITAAFNAAGVAGEGGNANQVATAALQGAATAPAFAAGEIAAPILARGTVRAVKAGGKAAQAVATPKIDVPTASGERITPAEQAAIADINDYHSGNRTINDADYSKSVPLARSGMKKLGINLSGMAPKDQFEATTTALENIGRHRQAVTQGGYVKIGGGVPELNDAASYAKAFGISEDQAAGELAALKEPRPATENVTADNIDMTGPKPKDQFKRAPQENTDMNPVKVNIGTAAEGDYAKVRTNVQQASNPVQVAGKLASQAIKGLSENDKANFFKEYVEHPETISSAENPRAVQSAVNQFKQLTDTAHATSQSLGGNTNYVGNYAPHQYDLTNPEDAARMEQIMNARGGVVNPDNFSGIDSRNRVFKDLREAEAAGFKQADIAPEQAAMDYANRAASQLRKQALVKGITEADLGKTKTRNIDLKNGQNIPISEEGYKQFKSLTQNADPGKVLQLYRKGNKGLKQTLLGLSLFHTNNINALQAFPTMVLRGHPILATKGLAGGYRAIFDKDFSARLQDQALKDGTIDAAARIGTPINFGSDFSADGKISASAALGEKAIFERSLPAMHVRFVQSIVSDLDRRGVSLDSAEARAYGNQVNQVMGFVNSEVRNFDPRVQKGLGDIALAPQFTRTKWETLRDAFNPSSKNFHANNVARQAVVGKYAMEALISIGVGALVGQKSDDLKDLLIRNLIHPSIPTPWKDSKGNNIELGLPSNYTSEAGGLASELKRDNNGHLSITARPDQVGGNVANYGRSRLAVIPSNSLKIATNTNYAGKPLYDPNAQGGKKTIQAVTTLTTGSLPIGLQGVANTKVGKQVLPGSSREIIDSNAPGSNPLAKSAASAIGATPRTDKTTGKGLQTTQYFNALNDAKKGLNRQEKDTLDLVSGSKKNPVTGAYDISPTVYDSATKANALLQNPKVLDHVIEMNKQLQASGQSTDPLYNLPKDQITKYLQHQTFIPGSVEARQWSKDNASWYAPLSKQRSQFFNTLPAGDPNRPKDPVQYPDVSTQTQSNMDAYGNITDSTQKAAFLASHPDVSDAFAKQAQYTNAIRTARGTRALKGYPEPDAQTSADLATYNSIGNKYEKSAFIKSHPNVTEYFTKSAMYGLENEASLDTLEGNSPSQKELKDIYNVGNYDVHKNSDGTYSLGSSLDTSSGGGGGGYSGGGSSLTTIQNNIQRIGNTYHKPPKIRAASRKIIKARGKSATARTARSGGKGTAKVIARGV